MKLITWLMVIIGALGVVTGIALLCAVPVWLLWNGVLVNVVSGVSVVSFWQALGMTFLCSLLFKSSNISSNK